jgi:hypothetical protein
VVWGNGLFKYIVGGRGGNEVVHEPRGEGVNRVIMVMVGGGIQVSNKGLFIVMQSGEKSHASIVKTLDPFGGVVVTVLHWDRDVDVSIVLFIPF